MDVKFKYGNINDLPATIENGTVYFCTNGIIYFDLNNTRTPFKCSQSLSLTVDDTTYTYDGSSSSSINIDTVPDPYIVEVDLDHETASATISTIIQKFEVGSVWFTGEYDGLEFIYPLTTIVSQDIEGTTNYIIEASGNIDVGDSSLDGRHYLIMNGIAGSNTVRLYKESDSVKPLLVECSLSSTGTTYDTYTTNEDLSTVVEVFLNNYYNGQEYDGVIFSFDSILFRIRAISYDEDNNRILASFSDPSNSISYLAVVDSDYSCKLYTRPFSYIKPSTGIPSSDLADTYAASPVANGNAVRTNGILYGQVDSTSTATKFTATIPGVTEYYDGLTIMLKNGVVTSASGFTININGLGAKQSYSNLAAATADTTLFNINYTMLFVYDSTRVSGGGWILYRGYDQNTNTIGYQLRTNSSTMPMKQITYRYRILFTSLDGQGWVPSTTSSSTNATASRTVNQAVIDPFGEIVYYGTTASVAAGSNPSAATLWQEYTLSLGYSFNRTGAALVMPYPKPIYIKCAPQSDGGAIIDADNPYVFELPSTEDEKIYIYLGRTYSATNIELTMNHPVYYYKDGEIRQWTNAYYPTKTSELTNDSGYITSAPVTSVNNKTGAVVLTASDVGAIASSGGTLTGNITTGATSSITIGNSSQYIEITGSGGDNEVYIHGDDGVFIGCSSNSQVNVSSPLILKSGWTPTSDYNAATKKYVDDSVGSVRQLPSVTSSDNSKALIVSNGVWSVQNIPEDDPISSSTIQTILNGTYTPT